jgi:hypothetical protein
MLFIDHPILIYDKLSTLDNVPKRCPHCKHLLYPNNRNLGHSYDMWTDEKTKSLYIELMECIR